MKKWLVVFLKKYLWDWIRMILCKIFCKGSKSKFCK